MTNHDVNLKKDMENGEAQRAAALPAGRIELNVTPEILHSESSIAAGHQ